MTAATGFKRLGLVLLAAIVVAAGVLAVANSLISPAAVRGQVLREMRAVTGLAPVLRGRVSVSLFPSGRVSFADVALGGSKNPALTAERLTAHLRFFPLLIGHVEIADVTLVNPTITIDFEPNGSTNWAALIASLASSQKPDAKRPTTFSEMRIDNGTVVLHDAGTKMTETLDDVHFSLAWPSISKSFGATGRFIWRDEPVDASITLGDFGAALAGNISGLKLRIASAPLKAAFEGTLSVKPTLKIAGTLAADSDALRDALVWFGQKPLPGGGFGHFSVKANAVLVSDSLSLTNANIDVDGNTANGVLTYIMSGRKTLQGTLAADTLDLSPYISTVKLLAANRREWSAGPISLNGLTGMDLDLRLSAAKVIMADAKIGRTAIGAVLHNGQLTVTVGEAQAYGGVIKGQFSLANQTSGVAVKSQLQFTNVDLESSLGQLFGLHRLAGKGDIAFDVQGSGDSILGVTRTLRGTADLTGEDGALLGLDVEDLLRRLQRRPLSGGGDFRTGSTPYNKISLALKIVQGTAKVRDLNIVGPAVKVALAGTASIPTRDLDLTGTATLIATSRRANEPPFSLPFFVQGSWDDPVMLPDAEALIQRSGAAAPLLNAVRERDARDAVRSALERLTGGTLPGPPPAPAAATAPDTGPKRNKSP